MTRQEFNEKYKQWIPQGWGGLEFDMPKVTEHVDLIMQDMVRIPGFELHQIKLKFGKARFYFDTKLFNKWLEHAIMLRVEERINELVETQEKEDEDWMDEQYRDEYHRTVASGMFFEWYPNLTGQWQKDKQAFVKEMKQIEERKSKQTD